MQQDIVDVSMHGTVYIESPCFFILLQMHIVFIYTCIAILPQSATAP